jgi:hypothetical protein
MARDATPFRSGNILIEAIPPKPEMARQTASQAPTQPDRTASEIGDEALADTAGAREGTETVELF